MSPGLGLPVCSQALHSDFMSNPMTPPPYQGPPAQYPGPQPQKPRNGLGTAAMVLGIIAAVFAIIPGLSFGAWLFAIPAIILGIIRMRKSDAPRGRATAGLIEGGAAMVVAIAVSIASAGASSGGFEDGVDAAQKSPATSAKPAEPSEAAPKPSKTSKPAAPKTSAAAPAAAPASEYGTQPADEQAFTKSIVDTRAALGDASTDLQRSQFVRNRDTALCATLGDGTATDWTGKITSIGANGEGKAYVEIEIADDVTIKTWNNAFSDAVDQTLIDPSAPFFNGLVAMNEGQTVKFTAAMVPGDGSCLSKANLTETFYGLSPEFVAKFSNVAAA